MGVTRFAITAIVMCAALVPGRPVGPAGRAGPEVAARTLTEAEQELVDWAIGRFSLAGLGLPEVEVAFHDERARCGGHHGVTRPGRTTASIDVCVPDDGSFNAYFQRRRTLMHELAHVWEHAALDDVDRSRLIGILDADRWNAPGSAWEDRGIERFAEAIVWGLYDQMVRPTMIDVPCRRLHRAFVAGIGHTPLGPLTASCQFDDRARR